MPNESQPSPDLPHPELPATHYKNWPEGEVSAAREDFRLRGGAYGDLGGLSVGAVEGLYDSEDSPEDSHAVPRDDDGLLIVPELAPGMFMPEWGPVKGAKSEKEYDFKQYPNKFLPHERPFQAAREFAKRDNDLTRAIGNVDRDQIAEASKRRQEWIEFAKGEGWLGE